MPISDKILTIILQSLLCLTANTFTTQGKMALKTRKFSTKDWDTCGQKLTSAFLKSSPAQGQCHPPQSITALCLCNSLSFYISPQGHSPCIQGPKRFLASLYSPFDSVSQHESCFVGGYQRYISKMVKENSHIRLTRQSSMLCMVDDWVDESTASCLDLDAGFWF